MAQRLLPKVGGGRVPVYEVFHVTAVNANFIRERDYTKLERSLFQETNVHQHRCIHRLVHQKPLQIEFDPQNGGVLKELLGDMWKQIYENELKYDVYKMPAIQ